MNSIKDLVDSITNNDWDTFIKCVCYTKNTNDQMNITEMLKSEKTEDLNIMWNKINLKCTQILQDYGPDINKLLKAISLFTLKCIPLKLEDQNFFDTVSLLYNAILIPSMRSDDDDNDGDDDDEVKSSVSLICELLWKESVDGAEELILNMVQYLLQRCLHPRPKMTFLIRLYSIRNAIRLIDFGSEEVDHLRDCLSKVVTNGNFLRNNKGKKILASIFCLNVDFARKTHAALKKLIMTSSKSSVSCISQVYFEAWKLAKEINTQELIECMEQDCLSDLVYTAIHSPRSGAGISQFVKFFKVLSHFHKDKSSKVVTRMLHKLYSGILFRSLKAPNGLVRANAMFILSDVFPLCDLNEGKQFNEKLLHQQLKEYEDLIEDPNIKTRQATVIGVFSIFSNYWEIIPLDERKGLMVKIMQICAWDVTSCEVRLCVVRGFADLFGNFMARHTLKNILPTLTNMIHDLSDRVRLAMVELLLKVKCAGDLKFWQIVPINHLLARLEEEDNKAVIRKIVTLLSDTYAPPTATLPIQLKRCIKLFKANWIAARKFYSALARSLDVLHGCKLIVYILEKLNNQTKESLISKNNNQSDDAEMDEPNEFEGGEDASLPLVDCDLATFLSETVYLLSIGMKTNLKIPQNEKASKILVKQISKVVPSIIKTYQNINTITGPLMLMCGHYNPKIFPTLSCSIISKLSIIPEPSLSPPPGILQLDPSLPLTSLYSLDDSSIGHMIVLLEVACNWRKGADVLNLCGAWLEGLYQQSGSAKVRPKSVNFNVPTDSKPILGILFARLMLQNKSCRSILIDLHFDQLTQLKNNLKHATVVIGDVIKARQVPALLLVESLRAYLIIEVLLHKSKDDCSALENSLRNTFDWCTQTLTSKLKNKTIHDDDDDGDYDDDILLFRNVLEVVTKLAINFLKLQILTSASLDSLTNMCSITLESSAFLTRNIFTNILVIATTLIRHSLTDLKLISGLLNSLAMLSRLDNFKDLLKQIKPKVISLFVMLTGDNDANGDDNDVGDDDNKSPHKEIQKIIESFVLLSVKSAVDAVQGNIKTKTCTNDDDDVKMLLNEDSAEGVYCLDLIFEIMGHECVKTGLFFKQFLKFCERLNDLDDLVGLLPCMSRLMKDERYKGVTLDRCYELFSSKCSRMLTNIQEETELVKWLRKENKRINNKFDDQKFF